MFSFVVGNRLKRREITSSKRQEVLYFESYLETIQGLKFDTIHTSQLIDTQHEHPQVIMDVLQHDHRSTSLDHSHITQFRNDKKWIFLKHGNIQYFIHVNLSRIHFIWQNPIKLMDQ